jgi:ketosteroid isomerase-like protein
MRIIFIALALAALAQGTTAAQDKTAVMASVHQFVDAFNKGDTKTAVAACADQTFIIDEFPPYEWRGPGGCAKWANDYDADAKKNGVTDGVVTLGTPRHVDITADRAYVVVPADYTYKQKGKVVKESGSMLTVVQQKGAAGWRIIAWAWAKN